MCVFIQEAIYDEELAIAIIDSDDVLTMVQKHLDLSIRYQDALDVFLSMSETTQKDMDKMGMALNKLSEEDPTFRVSTNEETQQTIIAGMGELHLEVIVDRLKTDFNVEVNKGAPKVAHRERLKKSVIHREVLSKQTGGRGKFADIQFEIGPVDEGVEGLQFVNEIVGGSIPKEYIPAIEKGFKNSMSSGLYGYPVESMKIRLFDGSFHNVDSDSYSFELVAKDAYRSVLEKCGVELLEPIMSITIISPEEFMGVVVSDFSRRKGIISEVDTKGMIKYISGKVPISNMFGYMTDLRSNTSGRGDFNMNFSHYEKT